MKSTWDETHWFRFHTTALERLHDQRRLYGSHFELFLRLERNTSALRGGNGKRLPKRCQHAVRVPSDQYRPRLCRCTYLLEPRSGQTRNGLYFRGYGRKRLDSPDQFGSCALDAAGEQATDGKPVMKPFWEITEEEVEKCLEATSETGKLRLFQRRRLFVQLQIQRRHASYPVQAESCQRFRTGPSNCGRLLGRIAGGCPLRFERTYRPHMAYHLVCTAINRIRPVQGRILRNGQLGRKPRRLLLRTYRKRTDYFGVHLANTGEHAQCS